MIKSKLRHFFPKDWTFRERKNSSNLRAHLCLVIVFSEVKGTSKDHVSYEILMRKICSHYDETLEFSFFQIKSKLTNELLKCFLSLLGIEFSQTDKFLMFSSKYRNLFISIMSQKLNNCSFQISLLIWNDVKPSELSAWSPTSSEGGVLRRASK